jgi:hypothetical protein
VFNILISEAMATPQEKIPIDEKSIEGMFGQRVFVIKNDLNYLRRYI